MENKEAKIVEAALRVFSRYGVKRTSMQDIAEEAGIVRQTLYLTFPSKNAVLRAAIRHHAEHVIALIKSDWADLERLSDKLDAYFAHSVIEPFQFVRAAPDFEDLASGFNDEGKAEIVNANTQFANLLAGALMPFKHNLADAGQTPAGFADFIQLAAHHLKYSARDETHLSDLITSLKAAILRMTDQDIPRVER